MCLDCENQYDLKKWNDIIRYRAQQRICNYRL